MLLGPSQPLRLGWSLPAAGRRAGDGDRLRGTAQACRVLGWKCGGLQARLFLKDLLGVIEGGREFGGKLLCTALTVRGRCRNGEPVDVLVTSKAMSVLSQLCSCVNRLRFL